MRRDECRNGTFWLLHSLFKDSDLHTSRGPGAVFTQPHACRFSAQSDQHELPHHRACENETCAAADSLWTVKRDVSGVSFPLGEETEIFHHSNYAMKLSGLLPGQSNMATAHKPAELSCIKYSQPRGIYWKVGLNRFTHAHHEPCLLHSLPYDSKTQTTSTRDCLQKAVSDYTSKCLLMWEEKKLLEYFMFAYFASLHVQ